MWNYIVTKDMNKKYMLWGIILEGFILGRSEKFSQNKDKLNIYTHIYMYTYFR